MTTARGSPSQRLRSQIVATDTKLYPATIMKAAWPKLSSPVYPKCTLRPMAAKQ